MEDEISVRTFWAGPSGVKEYIDSTSGNKQKVSAPDDAVVLPLPVGQRPFPVTSGDWFLRVIAYRATAPASRSGAVFIIVCDQVLDENDRYLYLGYVGGTATEEGVIKPVGAGKRYFRLRPAAHELRFKLIPAQPAPSSGLKAPRFQLGVELSQRRGLSRFPAALLGWRPPATTIGV